MNKIRVFFRDFGEFVDETRGRENAGIATVAVKQHPVTTNLKEERHTTSQ